MYCHISTTLVRCYIPTAIQRRCSCFATSVCLPRRLSVYNNCSRAAHRLTGGRRCTYYALFDMPYRIVSQDLARYTSLATTWRRHRCRTCPTPAGHDGELTVTRRGQCLTSCGRSVVRPASSRTWTGRLTGAPEVKQ